MATEKQIAANRRNAQKSTGPKTAEGKYKVRFNAVKHGMTASAAVLPFEDANSYDELRQALMDDYHPANSREHMLVEMIAVNYWRLLRARRVEVASFDLNIQTLKRRNGKSQVSNPDDDNALAVAFVNEQNVFRNIERYTEATERAYYRAIDTLRRLQNDREKREKIGFVSPPAAGNSSRSCNANSEAGKPHARAHAEPYRNAIHRADRPKSHADPNQFTRKCVMTMPYIPALPRGESVGDFNVLYASLRRRYPKAWDVKVLMLAEAECRLRHASALVASTLEAGARPDVLDRHLLQERRARKAQKLALETVRHSNRSSFPVAVAA